MKNLAVSLKKYTTSVTLFVYYYSDRPKIKNAGYDKVSDQIFFILMHFLISASYWIS
jgi:hypothetical protein